MAIANDIKQETTESVAMPIARETMTINDGQGNMVRVYKDDIAREINKQCGLNINFLNYGA